MNGSIQPFAFLGPLAYGLLVSDSGLVTVLCVLIAIAVFCFWPFAFGDPR
jgi:hypothetical protein